MTDTSTIEQTEIMTVDELLTNMAEVSRTYQSEREMYNETSSAYHKKERRVRLFLAYGLVDKFENPETLEYAKGVKTTKLLADDIRALVELECEAEFEAYKEAKHACETSEKAFQMFANQLSWHQTVKRSDSGFRAMENEADRQINRS